MIGIRQEELLAPNVHAVVTIEKDVVDSEDEEK
jgi:hypothetical protein